MDILVVEVSSTGQGEPASTVVPSPSSALLDATFNLGNVKFGTQIHCFILRTNVYHVQKQLLQNLGFLGLGWFFDFVITSGSGFLKTCFRRIDGFYKRTREIASRFFDRFFHFVRITIFRSKAVIWSRVCILDLYPLIFFCLKKGRTTQHWFFSSCLKERENHPLLVFTHVC